LVKRITTFAVTSAKMRIRLSAKIHTISHLCLMTSIATIATKVWVCHAWSVKAINVALEYASTVLSVVKIRKTLKVTLTLSIRIDKKWELSVATAKNSVKGFSHVFLAKPTFALFV
jgi:hypothetical protein